MHEHTVTIEHEGRQYCECGEDLRDWYMDPSKADPADMLWRPPNTEWGVARMHAWNAAHPYPTVNRDPEWLLNLVAWTVVVGCAFAVLFMAASR